MLTFTEWGTATHGLSSDSTGNLPATAGEAVSGNEGNLEAGSAITFSWYQPTEATDYTGSLRRYSKTEQVKTYCASGAAGSDLTWVDGTTVTLAGASTLIASAVALGAIALF